jgi:hypothetical protein
LEQKIGISKAAAIITGVMLLAMGGIAFFSGMNAVGAVILVCIGLVGVVGGLMGKFEEEGEN